MTVMIDSFFGVHPSLLRSGLWARMKPGEKDLYLYLMEESERCCTRVITATDPQVTRSVGTASRTLCNARKRLQEYGLIQYQSGHGNKYTYTICNPKTRQPYPGDPRVPMHVSRRARVSQNGPQPLAASPPPKQVQKPSLGIAKPSRQQEVALENYGLPGVF